METKIKMGSPSQQVSRVMSLYSRKSQKKCILNSPLALAFRSERWGERAVTMAEGGGEKGPCFNLLWVTIPKHASSYFNLFYHT